MVRIAVALLSILLRPADDRATEFEVHVRPLLIDRCFDCHGPDSIGAGGLSMDSGESLLAGGEHGPAVRPGRPDESLLWDAVRPDHEDLQMPPDGSLSPEELAVLRRWLERGAYWPPPATERPAGTAAEPSGRAWALQPLAFSPLPSVEDPEWPRNDIDYFTRARMEEHGLRPAPDADRATLLRRMSLDLTGLPPTPREVEEFLADDSPRAVEKVVDRLLRSPRYGERWGRHWLDLARYADTAGDSADYPVADAHRYRDYVIDAFQQDKPYDQFLREQIAGDLLAVAGPTDRHAERLVATGFLALARRFGVGARASRHLIIEDTIDTLGQATMGLTLRCARCHDHKFDPFSTRDYYALYGIFDSTRYPFPGSENLRHPEDLVPLAPPAEVEEAMFLHAREREALQATVDARAEAVRAAESSREAAASELAALTHQRALWSQAEPWTLGLEGMESTGWWQDEATGLVAGTGAAERAVDTALIGPVEVELCLWPGGRCPELLAEGPPASSGEEATRPVGRNERSLVPRWQRVGRLSLSAGASRLRLHRNAGDALILRIRLDPRPYREQRLLELDAAVQDRESDRVRFEALRDQAEALLAEAQQHLQQKDAAVPVFETAYAVQEGVAHDARVQRGGSPSDLGDVVPRGVPEILGGELSIAAGSGRLELANWLTSPQHPLTARVLVNRLWYHHFGRGLVATPSSFGRQGEPPSHPLLLDHLARRFMTLGWSIQAMHRYLLLSRTYQQSSAGDPESALRDPDNVWLSHARSRRLDAEAIRDSLLFVAGSLDESPAGAHPFPAVKRWNYTQHTPFQASYPSTRRSVYRMTPRIRKDPFFELFNGPDSSESTAQRAVSTVPQQALFFLNSELVHGCADELAARLLREHEEVTGAVRDLFSSTLGRPPSPDEEALAAAHVAAAKEDWNGSDAPPGAGGWATQETLASLVRVILSSNEFCYVP